MRLSDGTILMHDRAPYDPVKAHEYYIRTRHLKGRRKGRQLPSAPSRGDSKNSTYTVRLRNGKTVVLTHQQLVEQQAYAAKRVGEIKARLNELGAKLRKMIADAKARESKHKKPPTAADKRKAAQEAKQYRRKHRQKLSDKAKADRKKKPATHHDTVSELEHKIKQVKGRLQAAVAIQRALFTAKENVH